MVSELADWKGHPLGPPIVVHCSAGNRSLYNFKQKIKRVCSADGSELYIFLFEQKYGQIKCWGKKNIETPHT